jgi:hypothetical protein
VSGKPKCYPTRGGHSNNDVKHCDIDIESS